jgi:iron complex outermembrane recepter protein
MSRKSASQFQWIAVLACLPAVATAAEDAPLPIDELEVAEITGTRIARAPTDLANPIMSFDAQNIGLSGRTNLTDLLTQSPALVGSVTNYDTAGSQSNSLGEAGINLLDLRNLGTQRTLVLVNGRRHVAGMPGEASVDINSIPLELVDRIDVLTGGVSAIYGADGVSGVVNFVTKRNFEGLAIRGQAGVSGAGDGDNRFFSATGGRNLFDGRGHMALSYEYNTDKRVSTFDRARTGDPLRTYGLVGNPDDELDDPDVFDRVFLNDLRYLDSSRDGAIDTDWDFVPNFTGSGSVYDRGTELPATGLTQGGSSTPLAGYQGDLQPEIKRHSLNLFTHFDVSDRLRLFAEAKYIRTKNFTQSQPTFDFFSYIRASNPFMPDVIRDAILEGAAADVLGEFDDEPAEDGILLTRDHFDIGTRGEYVTRETLRSVLGVDGELGSNSRFEFSYTYGETAARSLELNYRLYDRYYAALDAVDEGEFSGGPANGILRCRVDLEPSGTLINPFNTNGGVEPQTFTPGANSGCAPLNLFGENVASDAALQFINADLRSRSKISHHVVSGSITGNLDRLSFQGGPFGYAFGAEYRKEKSSNVPDELIQQGLLADLATIPAEHGSFDVKEAFAEINVPVLKETRYAHSLAFGAALRLSDYSTAGNTTTWKIDARYAPVRDIMFRSTYSEAVRAPNITELFAPTGSGFFFVDDPCDVTLQGDGSQYRAANCEQLLTEMGIDPDDFHPEDDPEASAGIEGVSTGNPLLDEEKARTWTVGFLLRPSAVPGLSISLDWYNIRLKNAINTATAQEFAELCVDQPTLDNIYCDAISRDPDTGFVNGWTVRPENVANFATAGADFTVDYRFAPSERGDFHLSLSGGYLDKLEFIATPGADVDSDRGEEYAPKWLATADLSWQQGRWDANYGINYFSKTRRFTREQLVANPDLTDPRYFFYKAKFEHDVQVGFTPQDAKLRVYAGANNLFDQKPAIGARNYPVSFMGRFVYAGARLQLY